MFYKPKNAYLADVIPFYYKGVYYLYYLKDDRGYNGEREGVSWMLLTTTDFVEFQEEGVMIEKGLQEEQDLYVFTGSIFEHNGKFYCFYTGHNPHFFPSSEKPQQAILLAISDDLRSWKKDKDFYFRAPEFFEPHDFRDPFVYYDEEEQIFKMLLAIRKTTGTHRRRGATAVATSQDLIHWQTLEKPFYDPNNYYTHECPDLFKMGDYWYLIFSEFSDRVCTRYRISKSCNGPWITPKNDVFDSRMFYAAKSASDGKRRLMFGWNPTAAGMTDSHQWQWGGSLTVHEIYQSKNGELLTKCPVEILSSFKHNQAVETACISGDVTIDSSIAVGNDYGYSHIVIGETPKEGLISFSLTLENQNGVCGLFFNADDTVENAYFIRLEPKYNRIILEKWARPSNDNHGFIETERRCEFKEHNDIKVIMDNGSLAMYINDEVAFSARTYDFKEGKLGIYSSDMVIKINGLEVKTR